MAVEEIPNKVPGDVVYAEFKVRVLENSVMSAVEGRGADGKALLFGDFVGRDDARRIASAGRGDGRIKGLFETVAELYLRPRCFRKPNCVRQTHVAIVLRKSDVRTRRRQWDSSPGVHDTEDG